MFKFKKRKNYKRLRGHRQQLTRIQIDSIGKKASKKKAEKPAVEEAPASDAE